MGRHRGIRILLIVAALLMALMIPVMAWADVGNFSGDSDWGGSDSDWGSSDSDWDWGSSDSNWGWSSSNSSSSGDGDFSWFDLLVTVVVIGAVLVGGGAFTKKRKVKKPASQTPQYSTPPVMSTDLGVLKAKDPNFSQEAFLEKARNMYVQMQEAWEAKKWEPVRVMTTDALFYQLKRQLDEFIEKKQTNHVDRIAVLGAVIRDYRQDDTNDILTVRLNTRIVDYVTDDATGNMIRGSDSKELFMTYDWVFIRAKDVLTGSLEGERSTQCPSCGAPIALNQSGQCEYCGTVITSGVYDWALSEIKGISQRSK